MNWYGVGQLEAIWRFSPFESATFRFAVQYRTNDDAGSGRGNLWRAPYGLQSTPKSKKLNVDQKCFVRNRIQYFTHRKLWCSWRFVVLHVACDIVPMMHGSFVAGPALSRHENTSPSAEAWCKLSRMITAGSSSTAIDACWAMWLKYCCSSCDDLWSTLKLEIFVNSLQILMPKSKLTWK